MTCSVWRVACGMWEQMEGNRVAHSPPSRSAAAPSEAGLTQKIGFIGSPALSVPTRHTPHAASRLYA
ncbi:hypothetical protein GCM10008957_41380 [Deinococcus ruber]|uniref:Uncharacterized protein n=1 Tax=Deinococcus ruber TaxID=1848197 RepID=A0A918FDS8_9DEIO|nr:hypothetical protein GCM10008957_41380 [Deinococcus ruber]